MMYSCSSCRFFQLPLCSTPLSQQVLIKSKFGEKDDLTTVLAQQCRSSRSTIQRTIEAAGDNEALLFEALNLNDDIQKVLSEYKDLKKASDTTQREPEPAMIPIGVEPEEAGSRGLPSPSGGHDSEMMDDLDEMIFGKKAGSASEGRSEPPKKQQPTKEDDLISF